MPNPSEPDNELDPESLLLVNGGDKKKCDDAMAAFKAASDEHIKNLNLGPRSNWKVTGPVMDQRLNQMVEACKYDPGS
jgi:hypothetical protein